MRRAPIVLTATVAGTAAVLSFKAREPQLPAVAAASAGTPATGPSGATPSGSGASSSSTGSGSSSSGSGSGSTSGTSSTATKTATGDAIATRYGNAQVRVTVSGGKITKIEPLQLQGNDPKSVQISGSAEPYLRQSALTKQTAAIDAVSGATITSASYEASLQSALDKLGFKAADGTRGSSTVPDVQEHDGGPRGGPPGQFLGP
jgi:uncharacterized protein with FMN-binding domain